MARTIVNQKKASIALAASAILLAAGVAGLLLSRRAGAVDPGPRAYRDGDWAGALDAATRRLAGDRDDPDALRLYARATARLGRSEAAEAVYRRVGVARMEAEDLSLLGSGLLRRGLTVPALAALEAARDRDPAHAETLWELARHHASTRAFLEGADEAGRLARVPGWEARGGVLIGRIRSELNDPAGSAVALREAIARDPELLGADLTPLEARKLLAADLLATREPAEALAQLGVVPTDDRDAQRLLSRALLQEGRLDEAASSWRLSRGLGDDPIRLDPAPYVGSASCAACHASKWNDQRASRHAKTLRRAGDLAGADWPTGPLADRDDPAVLHAIRREGGRVRAETRVGGRAYTALVEYVLGSGHRGASLLARDDRGECRELRISRYPDGSWDRTSEHPAHPPDEAGYLGRPLDRDAERKCLHCHATDAGAFVAGTPPLAGDRGIGCERCHGPGGNHLLAVAAKFPDPAIGRPRLASAEAVMNLCGQCHQSGAGASASEADLARFQVPALRKSRCYTESRSMSCTTCHDPHRDAITTDAHYNQKCRGCHGAPSSSHDAATSTRVPTTCPVGPGGDCTRCHMRKVEAAGSTFIDHYIKINRRDGPGTARPVLAPAP